MPGYELVLTKSGAKLTKSRPPTPSGQGDIEIKKGGRIFRAMRDPAN